MKILNLTQHAATPEQLAVGVVDVGPDVRSDVDKLLAFDDVPTATDLDMRAHLFARLAMVCWCTRNPRGGQLPRVMIDPPVYLASAIERNLIEFGIEPLHSFAKPTLTITSTNDDGETVKTLVTEHVGFIAARQP